MKEIWQLSFGGTALDLDYLAGIIPVIIIIWIICKIIDRKK